MIESGSAILCALLEKVSSEIPPGWKTVWELSEETGRSQETMRRLLKKGLAAGVVDKRRFLKTLESGFARPVDHYHLRGKKK